VTPTVRLRRLAAEMRRLRESNKMTREEVSERTSINEATLYRLESARVRRPQKRTLAALLDLYGVTDPHRTELLELARNGAEPGWLQPYHSELPEEYTTYIAFEAEARSVSNYESLFVPGLLQTEAYAHAVITGVLPMATEREVEQRVRARIERQRLLTEPGTLKLWAILDEAALHRQVGSREVMRRQLDHLIKAANAPNVIVQVIPYSGGAHPGMPGSFVLLDFPNPADPAVVYLDSLAGDLFLEKEADIRRYRLLFEHLRAVAASPDQATTMLVTLMDE